MYTECETVLYSKQFDKLLTNSFTTGMWIVSYIVELTEQTHSNFGDWEAGENGTVKGNGRLRKDWVWSECSNLAWKKKRFLWNHKSARITWPLTFTLTLSTPWMHAHLETIVCKFGRNRAICVVVEVICGKSLQTDKWTDRQHRQTTDAARLY